MKLGISSLKKIQEAEFQILASRSFHSNVTAGKKESLKTFNCLFKDIYELWLSLPECY